MEDNLEYKIPEYVRLNNKMVDENGDIVDLEWDKKATHNYFVENINDKIKKFEDLEEKLRYLVEEGYYEKEFLEKYTMAQIKAVFKLAYKYKHRFPTYTSAFKFYNDYALKSRKKKDLYLETYADRLSIVALYHADGDVEKAKRLVKHLISQDFTPATPTLMNSGRLKRGEMVSCFLIDVADSIEDISRALEFSMQLSRRGGGVSINLTNLRARGESIKEIPGVCKGVVGVMKLFDNSFRYADQLGARQGAGAVYLNVFHADIQEFLATKKINADDDIRVRTLSIGVVIPDLFMEKAIKGEEVWIFYPHTVEKELGIPFADVAIDIEQYYTQLVENPNVLKKRLNPRKLLELIAQVQGESGYPYLMFSGNVNRVHTNKGKVKFSNLCTEIAQRNELSYYKGYAESNLDQVGLDISCNLSSLHIPNIMKNKSIKESVYAAMDIMTSVAEKTYIKDVPGVARANQLMRSVGLGAMGLHEYFVSQDMLYGDEDSIAFVDTLFSLINYYTLKYSNEKAIETGKTFYEFEYSTYASGKYFDEQSVGIVEPKTDLVKKIFKDIEIPTKKDWLDLKKSVMEYGLYHSYRLSPAPTGSISYVMSTTAGLTPIKQLVEERTYGSGKTYFPMPYVDTKGFLYETSYDIDKIALFKVISTIQKHIDQSISLEIGVNSNITTKDLVKYYLAAYKMGLKTLYYTRTRKLSIDECIACAV